MKFITYFLISFCVLMVISCGEQEEYMPEELYLDIFTELIVVNQVNEEVSDTEKDEIRNEVFTHYGISEEEFRISHEFYESQNKMQMARMDSISSRLRVIRDEISQAERAQKAQIDSLRQAEDNR